MTTPTPPAGPNDELIDAAQKRADLYYDDPRQDIVTDVMNAFFAGAAWQAARAALAVPAVQPSEEKDAQSEQPSNAHLAVDGGQPVRGDTGRDTLLPCPFCGSEAEPQWSFGGESVECSNCEAVMPAETLTEAFEAWNRRPAMSAPTETQAHLILAVHGLNMVVGEDFKNIMGAVTQALKQGYAAGLNAESVPEPYRCIAPECGPDCDQCRYAVSPTEARERDRKDAQRYHWLRDRLLAADCEWGDPPQPVLVFAWPKDVGVGGNCDMNVDAAIAAAA